MTVTQFRTTGAAAGGKRDLPLFVHETQGPVGAPWVTFVPGIGNDRSFWRDQAAALASSFQVITFDPWGHGDSPAPPENCQFSDIIEGMIQLWDHMQIAKSDLVGLGFGGSLALATAIAYPERVNRVVACCCRPRQPDDRRAFWRVRHAKAAELGMAALTEMTVDRWLSESFRRQNPEMDRQLRTAMARTTLAGYQAYVRAFIEMDFTDQLGHVRCPVQLVAAEHDHGGGPVAAMQEMARQIPSAQLAIIPDCGHICVAEAPAQLNKIIRQFLSAEIGIRD